MSKVGDAITDVWHDIIHAFSKLKEAERKLIPIAVSITQGVKTILDQPIAEIVAVALGKEKGEELLEKAQMLTNKVIIALDTLQASDHLGTDEEKVEFILSKVRLAGDDAWNAFWHDMASLLTHYLSDGKITWSEAIGFAEAYYKGHLNAKAA